MSARIRFLSFICILICFCVLCSARHLFACNYLADPFIDSAGSWTNSESCYATKDEAGSACAANQLPRVGCQYYASSVGGNIFAANPSAQGLYITYDYGQKFAVYWVISGYGGDSCDDLESRLSSECGGPGTYEINTENCIGHCLPSSQCAQAYEDACLRCGSCDQIAYFDNSRCIGVCEDCKDEYEQKKQECEDPFPANGVGDSCEYTCSCSNSGLMDEAEKACPFGFTIDDTSYPCTYTCLPCSELEKQCISQCNGKENVDMYFCEDVNGKPKDHLCQCKQDTCDEFYDSCHAACDTPECGGIKVSKCTTSGGEITYSRCECNGCSKTPENPDGPPPGDEGPTDEPGDGGDIIAWLKAIKGDTGRLVEQGDDHTAWFSSIKKNGDRTNQLLEHIAGKDTSVDVNVDTAGIAIGVTNQKLGDANEKLDGIGGTLTDIKGGLSDVGIGTKTAGGDYSVSEGSYGSSPTDADLPTKEAINSAFGTYTPPEDSNRDLIKDTISGFIPEVGSSDCNPSISLPVPTLSGLSWHSYSLNFCQYESIFIMIGNALVFLTALHELYRLA